jgi:hypothetical protein
MIIVTCDVVFWVLGLLNYEIVLAFSSLSLIIVIGIRIAFSLEQVPIKNIKYIITRLKHYNRYYKVGMATLMTNLPQPWVLLRLLFQTINCY